MPTANTNSYVNCTINVTADRKVVISGTVNNPGFYTSMEIYAAAPINRLTSYSGSGLPFSCAEVAFENSPNYAVIPSNGVFNVTFSYPNGFHSQDAFSKVPPSIFLKFVPSNGTEPIKVTYPLDDPFPLKTLGHRPNHKYGPLFYAYKDKVLPFETAERNMINYAAAKLKYDIA